MPYAPPMQPRGNPVPLSAVGHGARARARTPVWVLFGLVTIAVLGRIVVDTGRLGTITTALMVVETVLFGLLFVTFALVAALIVSRRPGNLVGWLMLVPGLGGALGFVATGYLDGFVTAPADVTAVLLLALWFQGWSWLLLIFPVLQLLQLFPTGRPLAGGWRWLTAAAPVLLVVFVAVATLLQQEFVAPGTRAEPWAVENPIGWNPGAGGRTIDGVGGELLLGAWLAALAIVAIASPIALIVRYRRSSAVERAQIRWLLVAAIAFAVTYVAILVAIFVAGDDGAAGPAWLVLLPVSLLPIPLSIAAAILRNRLWDIDIVIRRSLVYVPLTAILGGVFSATMSATNTLFGSITGTRSQAATVLTTIVIVAAFDPLKRWLQRIVDARFKETAHPLERWKAYGQQVRAFVDLHDAAATAARLLEEAAAVFEATGGRVHVWVGDELRQVHTVGEQGVAAELSVALEHGGRPVGRLELGPRRANRPFDASDRVLLADSAGAVATAIALAQGAPATGTPSA